MKQAHIDHLVLGCTHYPYLIPQIEKILPEGVKIIDSGAAVAKQTKKVMESLNILNESHQAAQTIFYSNSDPSVLNAILGNGYKAIHKDF
jgi:glutamate racemase